VSYGKKEAKKFCNIFTKQFFYRIFVEIENVLFLAIWHSNVNELLHHLVYWFFLTVTRDLSNREQDHFKGHCC
jgi:hypothetical protein